MYRTIDAAFWTDPKILRLTHVDRYVFLYLITNPHSHVGGIYYLPFGAAIDETGLTTNTLGKCIDTLSGTGIVRRDTQTSVIWVVNMMAYQGCSPKVAASVGKHLHSLHGSQLVGLFLERYQAVQSYYDSHLIDKAKATRPKIPNSLRFQVLERDSHTCQYCGMKPPDVALEVDHVIPESRGGATALGNLKTACWACNSGKSDRVSIGHPSLALLTGTEQEQKKEQNGAVGGQRFVPPSVDDVRTYCQERGNAVDPEAFVAFYGSKGWMVGKNKMRDWHLAIVTWEKNRSTAGGNSNSKPMCIGGLDDPE